MQVHDIVRLKNTGDTRWTDKYNNQVFACDPGKDIVIPFGALCLWMGNPDAKDVPNGQRHRRAEFNRLVIRYGGADNPDLWHENTPKIEAYDFDNNRIITVIDDPEGKGVHSAQTTVEEQEILQSQVNKLTRELAAMRSRMESHDDEVVDEDIREDAPSRVPTGSRVVSSD